MSAYSTEVKVVKDSDGQPLEDASVSCDHTFRGYTDSDGICTFDLNYSGDYYLSVSKSGYTSASGTIKSGKKTTIRLG